MTEILREIPYKDVVDLRYEYLGAFAAMYEYAVEMFLMHNSQLRVASEHRGDDFVFNDYPFADAKYNENVGSDENYDATKTQTYWTDMFLYWIDNEAVKEGSVLGFFQDIKQNKAKNTICYYSFQSLRDHWGAYQNNKGKDHPLSKEFWKGVQQFFDLNIVYFQFYSDCSFELFIISLGIKFGTVRGFLQSIISMLFFWDQVINSESFQKNIVDAINQANFSGKTSDWEIVGKYVGFILASVLEYKVPGFEFIYG